MGLQATCLRSFQNWQMCRCRDWYVDDVDVACTRASSGAVGTGDQVHPFTADS